MTYEAGGTHPTRMYTCWFLHCGLELVQKVQALEVNSNAVTSIQVSAESARPNANWWAISGCDDILIMKIPNQFQVQKYQNTRNLPVHKYDIER